MKRPFYAIATILLIIVAVFGVLVMPPLPKVKAHQHCSNYTLNGIYGWTGSGWWYTGGNLVPVSVVGQVAFNGIGGLSGQFDLIAEGTSVTSGYQTFTGATYSVSPTCVFTMSGITFEEAGISSNGTVVDAVGGSEIIADLESTGTNFTLTLEVKKILGWD